MSTGGLESYFTLQVVSSVWYRNVHKSSSLENMCMLGVLFSPESSTYNNNLKTVRV